VFTQYLVLWVHSLYVIYIWKYISAHELGNVSGVAFITTKEQLQQSRCCYFTHADSASWGLSLFSYMYKFHCLCQNSNARTILLTSFLVVSLLIHFFAYYCILLHIEFLWFWMVPWIYYMEEIPNGIILL